MTAAARPVQAAAALVAAVAGLAALAPPAGAAADEPRWKYFRNAPALAGADTDWRVIGCFPGGATPQAGCTVDERTTTAAAPAPWDVQNGSAAPSFTTLGNAAETSLSSFSAVWPGPDFRPISSTREYISPFTDGWRNGGCNAPGVVAGGWGGPTTGPVSGGTDNNDINAAIFNVFVAHNHMHDWAYNLGFTEARYNLEQDGGDRVVGDVQAAATQGAPTFSGRDGADSATPADGTPVQARTHLWQPIAGAFYPACTDGSFDMSLLAHQYAHAIANRMVGGPTEGLTSTADGQARAIGEGFADLAAVEYLHEYRATPPDDEDPFTVKDPFTIGGYVTGNGQRGVRNYSMANSPLNYSNVQGYDGSGGASPGDDGEIWAAVNHDIRQLLLAKYPSSASTAAECADGRLPADSCPGNRRWIQLAFDALLLMPSGASMVQARDAMLAADQARFSGANQSELWTAFARRGLGQGAASAGTNDPSPTPAFSSPLRGDESTLSFRPVAAEQPGAPAVAAELFVGDHEAGTTPVADTDPSTPLDDKVDVVPGTYAFTVRADGYGTQKFQRNIPASSNVALGVGLPTNRASGDQGAQVTGDGTDRDRLIDDTEETNWQVVDEPSGIAGANVTVDLAGGLQIVDRVNVSALLRGTDDGDEKEDANNQNRFTALRQFRISACTADCADDASFSPIFTSPADAFPGVRPRPVTPDLNLRSFDVPDTPATHVRLEVLTNQCTGLPAFSDPALENDPGSSSDCSVGNTTGAFPVGRVDRTVRAAELQVFSRDVSAGTAQTTTPSGQDPRPVLSALKMSRRFRLGRLLPRASAVRTGTTIRFRLSEAGSVTYSFRRARPGRRVGRRCLAPTRARRRRARCTRFVAAGRLKRAGRAGLNRLRFQGRLSRRRALRPGRYRLTVVATDGANQRSAARTKTFTLLPRKPRR